MSAIAKAFLAAQRELKTVAKDSTNPHCPKCLRGGRGPHPAHCTVETRFWNHVRKSSEGCWEWTASLSSTGYGGGLYDPAIGRTDTPHRLSYRMANGDIPKGMHVCHRCDNRKCVRPSHLFLGTRCDNMRDAWTKGRISIPIRGSLTNERKTINDLA